VSRGCSSFLDHVYFYFSFHGNLTDILWCHCLINKWWTLSASILVVSLLNIQLSFCLCLMIIPRRCIVFFSWTTVMFTFERCWMHLMMDKVAYFVIYDFFLASCFSFVSSACLTYWVFARIYPNQVLRHHVHLAVHVLWSPQSRSPMVRCDALDSVLRTVELGHWAVAPGFFGRDGWPWWLLGQHLGRC
jgi:hypothetical protein